MRKLQASESNWKDRSAGLEMCIINITNHESAEKAGSARVPTSERRARADLKQGVPQHHIDSEGFPYERN
jgi:hypothetical protein